MSGRPLHHPPADAADALRGRPAVGFVLVGTVAGQERAVCEAIARVEGVTEVVPLLGEHDLLVKVESPDRDRLGRTIERHIRPVPGVVATRTLTTKRL